MGQYSFPGPLIGAGFSTPSYVANSLFVDPVYGNDLTGIRGRSDRPFKSLYGVNKASKKFDTIYGAAGVYTGALNALNLCPMAFRQYVMDPGAILVDQRLVAPPIYFADLVVVTSASPSNAVFSSTCTSKQVAFNSKHVGCSLVITDAGSNAVVGRYLILSVTTGTATLNGPAGGASTTSGACTGYIEPGPMWSGGNAVWLQNSPNGVTDALICFADFTDPNILLNDSGTSVTVPGVSTIRTVNPKLYPDLATPVAPNFSTTFTNVGGGNNDPLWQGTYAQVNNTANYLNATVTTLQPNGAMTFIASYNSLLGNAPGSSYVNFGGFNNEGSGSNKQLTGFQTGPTTTPLEVGGSYNNYQSVFHTLVAGQWNVITARSYQYATSFSASGASNDFYWNNSATAYGTATGTNTGPAVAGTLNLLSAGLPIAAAVGGFIGWDGAAPVCVLLALQNALLNDQGAY